MRGAGRLLQDGHTLREYNIQKPSVLQMLPPGPETRLAAYVRRHARARAPLAAPGSKRIGPGRAGRLAGRR